MSQRAIPSGTEVIMDSLPWDRAADVPIADPLRAAEIEQCPCERRSRTDAESSRAVHDPTDPVGRLLFKVLAVVAEFEADLIRLRTREGMKIAKAKGRLRGKQPK